ncbi:MAG: CDP-diacylglycerol--glycerol-3-phosphate 3-phosphatidyltransferase [Elusimicrobia bacterium]|nr:CDP-diacylglycerol--glycerol-3-phosphate 3-phosphatidyltransferase [Elusimicrobiota bacterium]MBI2916009.1 CDP-diacylglycerol--glycerol-3-phosphate 3-phosphatidyltransferase [Elusimicrobiota bacterium]MBI3012217.1 CDP-diacylglycerol--glycerol-3-phosphate 3-phosphatidyltransferase [Elusimicrobiota bacterium]MBI4217694.1 CDP-diacylglycerol--glycerol-3-phosphate 3-phosphatidyltransferase [Elusimicrobiota bacterium]
MTLANRITILRIALIPIFVILYLQKNKFPNLENWTLAVFSFAILTDLLDGLAARLKKQKTQLGSFLDPLADKLLLTATFILLAYSGQIDLWVFVTIFSRDLLIILGWSILYILTSSSVIEPRMMGKLSTCLQMISAIALLFPVPSEIAHWIVRGMITVTVISAIDYIWVGSRRLDLIPK